MDKDHLRRLIFRRLKKSKFIFNSIEWVFGYKDIKVQKQIHSTDNKKDPSVIRSEKRIIRDYWKCGVFHYYRYGLSYLSLDRDELLDYVPTYYHHKRLEQDHDGVDTVYFGDKLTQAVLFKDRDIPTAEVVAYNRGNQWLGFSGDQVISIRPAIENLLKTDGDKLFFKPTGGQGGFGIMVLKRIGRTYYVNGEAIELPVFIQDLSKGHFIMQRGLVQSQQMMSINPSSVNTLRVVVQKERDRMVMKTCIIRMGRKGKEVDNSAQGGISVKVNIDDGHVSDLATAEHGGGILYRHPDTNKSFNEIIINNWDILKTEIEDIGTKLIEFKNLALDIAVTEEGAKLLEYNFRYGVEHQQCVLGGVRRILGIYPDI